MNWSTGREVAVTIATELLQRVDPHVLDEQDRDRFDKALKALSMVVHLTPDEAVRELVALCSEPDRTDEDAE